MRGIEKVSIKFPLVALAHHLKNLLCVLTNFEGFFDPILHHYFNRLIQIVLCIVPDRIACKQKFAYSNH